MQRRQFLEWSITGGACLIVWPTSLAMEGCSFSVKGMLNTILDSLNAILKVAEPNASWLPGLQNAITALQQAEAQWENTGTVSIIEDALNTVAAVCAVIPLTELYSPLIDVIVAGIEAVLNFFAPATVKLAIKGNPHQGRVTLNKPHFAQTYQGAYRGQWNDTARGLGLTQALI